ncbi:SGNH/GDSL hydrolase family protein [Pseudonocardiaceae bacterium YIM PH 21723]|nr:SGNH/GDSL hydrolase family protein [Pseudonocardiaceae bacterium YIM PH 21723]
MSVPLRSLFASSVLVLAMAAAAPVQAAPQYSEYVALGDSWSADATLTRITTEFVPAGCAQSASNYPHQVAKALKPTVFKDATCGAATTEHLYKPQNVLLGQNPAQFDRLTKNTDLVTMGMGGNDAELAAAVTGCLNLAPPPLGISCKSRWIQGGVDKMSQNIADAKVKVAAAIDEIKARSPKAKILIVDYMAGVPEGKGCYPKLPAWDVDIFWLHDKLAELATMERTVAQEKGVTVVDTYHGSEGHDACQAPGVRWVEGVIPLNPGDSRLIVVPFHPNQLGADWQAKRTLAVIK